MASIGRNLYEPNSKEAEFSFEPVGAPQVPGADDYADNYQGPLSRDQYEAQNPEFTFEPAHQPGYDPNNLTIAGQRLPEWAQPAASKITDIAIGANDTLAGALGLPISDIDMIMRDVVGKGFLDNPGDGKALVQKALMSIPGLGADKSQAFDEWWANLGTKAGTQALMSMAMLAGAGPMAAAGEALGGGSVTGAVLKNIGETAIKHPGMVLASDAGAVLGGATAPQAAPYLKAAGLDGALVNPQVLEFLGSLVGGIGGAAASSIGKIRPSLPGATEVPNEKFSGLPKMYGNMIKQTETGPALLTPKGFTEAGNFSMDDIGKAIQGYKDKVTSFVGDRVQRIIGTGSNDPAITAQRLREGDKVAYKVARQRIETPLWKAVNMKRPAVPQAVANVKAAAQEIAASVATPEGRMAYIPGDYIQSVMKLKKPTLQQLHELSSVLRTEAVNLGTQGSKFTPSDRLRGNFTKLANALDDAIEASYPADQALVKAKAFSTWLHDRFSRGPVGQFAAVRTPEAGAVDAQGALQQAMRDSRFGTSQADIGTVIGRPNAIEGRSEDYLRSTVADAYRSGRPISSPTDLAEEAAAAKAAANHMNSDDFKRFAKAFPRMDAILQRQFNQLQGAIGEADAIKRSAFFNKAGTDPQSAVEQLFNSGTKIRDAEFIMKRIGQDPDAMDAMKNALVEKIGNSVNWDPSMLNLRLNAKDTEKLMTMFMGEKDFGRLKRLISAGMAKQGASDKIGSYSPSILGGRVIGSFLFRAGGLNTIQATSIGAKLGGSLMERLFHLVPPDKLLARALVDPKWERYLLSKDPTNLESFRTTTRLIGSLIGSLEAGKHQIFEEKETNK